MKLAEGGSCLWAALLALVAVGCASRPPDVINIDGMIPIKDTRLPDVRAYQVPTFDRAKYHGLYLEPATLYTGPDADFGNTSPEDRQRIAAMLNSEMQRVLSPDFRLVNAPGP